MDDLKLQIIQKGVKELLNERQVPERQHLAVVAALARRMNEYKTDLKRHEEHDVKHEELLTSHERQINEWDQTVKKLHALPHIKGEKGEPGRDGFDGVTPDKHEIAQLAAALIPAPRDGKDGRHGRDGKDGLPGSAATLDEDVLMAKLVKKLQKERLLDVSHIKGAQKFMKDGISYKVEELMHGAGSSTSSGVNVYSEVVSGSGTSWTLAKSATIGSLRLFAYGQRLTPTVDYSISGAAITTVSSWVAGTLLADYSHV